MSSPVPGTGNGSASRRTRSARTKLTGEEYARLESLAAQRGLTPWRVTRAEFFFSLQNQPLDAYRLRFLHAPMSRWNRKEHMSVLSPLIRTTRTPTFCAPICASSRRNPRTFVPMHSLF